MDVTLASALLAYANLSLAQIRVKDAKLEPEIAKAVGNVDQNKPLATQPQAASALAQAAVYVVANAAGLNAATQAAVVKVAGSLSALTDTVLTQLVTAKTLTADQAKALGLSAALYELLSGAADLVAAIRTNAFAELGTAAAATLSDLVKVSTASWTTLFTAHATSLPAGATAAGLATLITSRLAVMYPSAALASALPAVNAAGIGTALDELAPLYKLNPKVVGVAFTSLNLTGLNDKQVAQCASAHATLVRLANAYPGLQLVTLFDDTTQASKLRATTAQQRVAYVAQAFATAGDGVFRLDLSVGSADLAKLGIGKLAADAQQMVSATVRAYQRVSAVTASTADLVTVISSGFASAHAIARLPLAQFQSASGLAAANAQAVWRAARTVMADTALTASGVLDAVHGGFDQLGVNNQPATTGQYLAQLANYQDMFGSLAFCDCDECQSILGPVAYFVDLMKFIDENLRTIFNGYTSHPLDLKTRRPDLWTLELSCDAVDTRVATLDIVAQVLENNIALRLGYTGSLTDRNAVAAIVYPALATAVDSFAQPFDLGHARSHAYLTAAGRDRAQVANALGASADVRARAELELSVTEAQVTTTVDTDLTKLGHIYGIAFGGTATAIANVDASVLGPAMGLSRTELGQIIVTAFVTAGGAHPAIQAAKRSASSVQADVEWVSGLTADALDRMHRLARLTRKLGWTFPETDLTLSTFVDTALANVQNLANLHAVRARFGTTAADACALVGPLPQTLIDSAFNTPLFLAANPTWPDPTYQFKDPAFLQNTAAPADQALARLTAGLGVDLDDLTALARHLAPHLAQESNPGFDPAAANEANRYFVLSAPNLTLLYRHARLARLLSLEIDELFELLSIAGLDRVSDLADLLGLLGVFDWWSASGYALDDVALVLGQAPLDPASYLDPATVAPQLVASAATTIDFSDTVFAAALGTTEQTSLDLLTGNPTVVESLGNGVWRLIAGIDLATIAISIPASAVVPVPPSGTRAVTADDVRTALAPHVPSDVLVRSLASTFGVTTDKLVALAALAGQSTSSDSVVHAVRGDGSIDPLVALIAAVKPLAVALTAACWDATAIGFVGANAAVFGAGALPLLTADATHPNVPRLTLEQLRSLSTYARVATRSTSATVGADLQAVLAAFAPATPGFATTSDAVMTRALGAPNGLVVGLRGPVVPPTIAATALDQLDQAVQLAVALGIDGATLGELVSDDEPTLSHAADALDSAIGAAIADPTARATQLDTLEQPIREAKRDGLVAYLLHSITPHEWDTADELYEYFLIDVEAGGCQTTSWVVSATNTAQLYVYRASMNLERDATTNIVLALSQDALGQWAWRQTYRTWQANREVFLWPENYLDPDLRDDKTPLFQDLENTLLQTNIDDQNVLDAYTTYLAGLEELANLKIAGAYHDTNASPDVLHLFGAASTDPPTYYYRTCQNLSNASAQGRQVPTVPAPIWSPWQKISVQITGRRVSPVVFQGRLYVFWVDTQSRSINKIQNGANVFTGYQHTMALRFTILRPDETWAAPQTVMLPIDLEDPAQFGPNAGQINDPVKNGVATLDPQRRIYVSASDPEPIDGYTLSGPNWDYAWMVPQGSTLNVQMRDFQVFAGLDLFARTATSNGVYAIPPVAPYPRLLCAKNGGSTRPLESGTPATIFWPITPFANAVAEQQRLTVADLDVAGMTGAFQLADYSDEIATISATADVLAVPGCEEDMIVQDGADPLLVQGSVYHNATYVVRRLGSTLVTQVARDLFEQGLDYTLSTPVQLALAEAGIPITPTATIVDDSSAGSIDYTGPFGVYYRELYFHIPYLIATALNANGQFAAAQRWFQFIFDPTSTEQIDVSTLPPDEAAYRVLDRVWRYREFRGLDVTTLRDILTDQVALELYQEDPFNPWAIARRRISAFQKAVVMRYVGNLLDWADSLFTQFTMETVNEAMMLYVMADDILGPRPTEIGDCGDGVTPMNYATIGPLIDGTDDFLVELEGWNIGARPPLASTGLLEAAPVYAVDHARVVTAAQAVPVAAPATDAKPFTGINMTTLRTASWGPALGSSTVKTKDAAGGRTFDQATKANFSVWAAPFGWSIVRQVTPVFCVPVNTQLLGYWDRVADRLYKIRHCEDIDGNVEQLPLFAPPISPADLAAIEAAGLTLGDVLGTTSGNMPPYRFTYLIDRAKAFTASLAGFGGSLLSSLEKKDAEHLNRVRLTQQMNIAQLTTQTRQLEIQAATEALSGAQTQLQAAQDRSTYYQGLLDNGRSNWETAQSVAVHGSSLIHGVESAMAIVASVFGYAPQVGSPFAMTYGGKQLSTGTRDAALALGATADVLQAVSASAGLEASFDRRDQTWTFQKAQADRDVQNLTHQVNAAQIRLNIANNALALQQKSIDQLQQMIDLTDGKFTNLGLYTWLAAQLQQTYRAAYLNALGLAALALQAFRFERPDDTGPGLASSYWDASHAGLLAGEQLLLDLQTLERRFLETNYRTLEIDQPFALSQIDPQALITLRETGECDFTIPEVFFDLFYPGHYKRRIRAVRLTIPCVTPSYVNVSAELEIEQSWVRSTATPGAQPVSVPLSRSVVIATSTAQNDAGVFELSFRDERYMPFEWLGAISKWHLTLPKAFRQFDYETIKDVIVSISYNAVSDPTLRTRVEAQNAALEGAILQYLATTGAKRAFSLRQDFSGTFTRLLRSAASTQVTFELTDRNFPMFVAGRTITVTRGAVVLRTASGVVPTGFTLTIDGTAVSTFAIDATLGNLPSAALPAATTSSLLAQHTISVTAAGSLAPTSPPPGDTSAIDSAKLFDILLYLEYRIA